MKMMLKYDIKLTPEYSVPEKYPYTTKLNDTSYLEVLATVRYGVVTELQMKQQLNFV